MHACLTSPLFLPQIINGALLGRLENPDAACAVENTASLEPASPNVFTFHLLSHILSDGMYTPRQPALPSLMSVPWPERH